jgi:hypothetical protein
MHRSLKQVMLAGYKVAIGSWVGRNLLFRHGGIWTGASYGLPALS